MNPELRRYFWQELTLPRLVVMPVFLLLVFFIAHRLEEFGPTITSNLAAVIFFLLVFVWGCRRSAASIATEVREATWEAQRMSAMGPWSVTWGKLLGSTAFPWYGGIICLAAIAIADAEVEGPYATFYSVANLAASGLLAQCLSLATVLAWLRKWRPTRRLPVTLGQFLGLLVGLRQFAWFKFDGEIVGSAITVVWYGISISSADFILISLLIFLGWTLFSVYRLVGAELQVKSTPWGWSAFTIFLMAYVIGFFPAGSTSETIATAQIWLAFAIALAACYAMLFLDPKNVVTMRVNITALTSRRYRHFLMNCPNWFSALLLALAFGLIAALSHLILGPVIEDAESIALIQEYDPTFLLSPTAFGFSLLAFLLRDAALILWLNIRPSRRRADMAAIFYLMFAYGILPSTLYAFRQPEFAALFFPDPRGYSSLVSGSFQAVVMMAILAVRWRRAEAQFVKGLTPARLGPTSSN